MTEKNYSCNIFAQSMSSKLHCERSGKTFIFCNQLLRRTLKREK